MRLPALYLFAPYAAFLVACASGTEDPAGGGGLDPSSASSTASSSASSTGPASSSSSSSSSSSTGGTGGAGGSGGATSSSTGVGGADPCPQTYISIGPDGSPHFLGTACADAYGSDETANGIGYKGYTGAGSPEETFFEACSIAQNEHITMRLPLLAIGTGATEDVVFDLIGDTWTTTDQITVNITWYGPVHGHIEGTLEGTMTTSAGDTQDVVGDFSLCHVTDMTPPP